MTCWRPGRNCFLTCAIRKATSWINMHVIEPSAKEGNAKLAARLKLAFTAGPQAVRAILDNEDAIAVDVADELYGKKLQLDVKMDMALTMPMGSVEQRNRFVKYVIELEISTKKLDLAAQKLAMRCEMEGERYRAKNLQLELAIKRAEENTEKERTRQCGSSTGRPNHGVVANSNATLSKCGRKPGKHPRRAHRRFAAGTADLGTVPCHPTKYRCGPRRTSPVQRRAQAERKPTGRRSRKRGKGDGRAGARADSGCR